MEFWAEVKRHKDAGGNNRFMELADFATHILTLPFSNAEVERVFSQMNLVKTNRMQVSMINAIIMIRSSLKNAGKFCHDFEISKKMIKGFGFGSTAIYDRQVDEDENIVDLIEDNFF